MTERTLSQKLQEDRLDTWYTRINELIAKKKTCSALIAQYIKDDDVQYLQERDNFKAYCHEVKYLRKKIAKDIEDNGIRWGYICPK